jgi:hypothetical protein
MHFVSLDGIDWHDPVAKEQHYIGSACIDFMARVASDARNPLKPVKKENIPRVPGSAVLKMYDHNYISLPRAIADQGTPIVINNACSSWHRLAENYTFGNARAYIGTLWEPKRTISSRSCSIDILESLLLQRSGRPSGKSMGAVFAAPLSRLVCSRSDCALCVAMFPRMSRDASCARCDSGGLTCRKREVARSGPKKMWKR